MPTWLRSVLGVVAGLPAIVLGVFTPGTAMALSANATHILMVVGGLGLVGLGIVSQLSSTSDASSATGNKKTALTTLDSGQTAVVPRSYSGHSQKF
jgi:hypothetical protein